MKENGRAAIAKFARQPLFAALGANKYPLYSAHKKSVLLLSRSPAVSPKNVVRLLLEFYISRTTGRDEDRAGNRLFPEALPVNLIIRGGARNVYFLVR